MQRSEIDAQRSEISKDQKSPPPATWAVWDVETLRLAEETPGGWGNIRGFGLACAVALDETGTYHSFGEGTAGAHMLAEFLSTKSLIVGFNSLRFDTEILAGYVPAPVVQDLRDRSLDLLQSLDTITGRRACVSLSNAAQATIGAGKTLDGGGVEAVLLWRSGDPDKRAQVLDYCRADVMLTHGLWTHGITHGYVFAPLRKLGRTPAQPRARIDVPWRWPE